VTGLTGGDCHAAGDGLVGQKESVVGKLELVDQSSSTAADDEDDDDDDDATSERLMLEVTMSQPRCQDAFCQTTTNDAN